ncbi:hypothetical protein J4G43_026115 [Bradyrhizobium barranii subsp. barranii]|uniref:Uncharacterized protein n=2 Tax=Bradyrhizobium barranii subsp. barranii TaxID=2823807 RepID=A0A9X9XKU9_9BRAD|nr:hypothetical protein [Bradyrhizobium barranii]UEM08293.1 hypothetical protein J4G43_026115 [Bradyrhizobium barranii subsp. barranii]
MQPEAGHTKTAEAAKNETIQGCTHVNNPANDNAHTTPPIVTRLRRAGRYGDLGNLVRFAGPDQVSQHADNDDVASGYAIDTVYEIRPNEGEIERACLKQDVHGIGLRFDGRGRITAYRAHDAKGDPVLDDQGNEGWFPAREGYRQSKGRRRVSQADLAEESAQHLSLRGSGGFPERSSYVERGSGGADAWRMRHARMNHLIAGMYNGHRLEIDRLGIGSRATFAEARSAVGLAPAERGPTVVARGAVFLAGKTRRNALAAEGSFVGAPDAVENAIAAAMDAPAVRHQLGEHAVVLNDALDGLTARDMASKRGWGNSKGAEQRAVRAQDKALEALAEAQKQAA